LPDDNCNKHNRQYWPDDDEDPNVDLFIRDAKYVRPIYQHIYTPVEDLIHHFLPSSVRDIGSAVMERLAKIREDWRILPGLAKKHPIGLAR